MVLKRGLFIGACISLFVIGFALSTSTGKNNISNANSDGTEIVKISGSVPVMGKDEVIEKSDVIAKGKVSRILESKWSNPNFERGKDIPNMLQTDIVVEVDEIYKGEPNNKKELTIRIDEGEAENLKVVSEGYPKFVKNEELVVFLSKDDSILANKSEDYYILTGMFQGKYTSDGEENFYIEENKRTLGGNDEANKIDIDSLREKIKQ